MKAPVEGNWVYLAHESSKFRNKNDYSQLGGGRQPIFIARSKKQRVNAFIKIACVIVGAMLCRYKARKQVAILLAVPRLELQQIPEKFC